MRPESVCQSLRLTGQNWYTNIMHLSEKAYHHLKKLILSGRLGADSILSERSLAERLSVSRVPVREAIMALEREGLLIVVPRSGVHIRRMTIEEVRELYEVRQAIEGMAASLCAARGRRGEMREVRRRLQALARAKVLDHAAIQHESALFHRALFDLCENKQLQDIYRETEPKISLNLRLTAIHATGRIEQALAEHIAIASEIEAGHSETAEHLTRVHLENGKIARMGILTKWNGETEAPPAAGKISARRTARKGKKG